MTTALAPIRLYSQRRVSPNPAIRARDPFGYLISEYFPDRRQLRIVEMFPKTGFQFDAAEDHPWPWAWEPWEKPRVSTLGLAPDTLKPMYERAVDGQLPSPGYGPVPSFEELGWAFADRQFGLCEQTEDEIPECARRALMQIYAQVMDSPQLDIAGVAQLLGALRA